MEKESMMIEGVILEYVVMVLEVMGARAMDGIVLKSAVAEDMGQKGVP